MARVTSSLSGFDALQRALKAAPEAVKVRASDVIAKSAFAVAQRARSLAPVRTGRLKAAISSSVRGLSGRVGFVEKVHYWRFVEFGTVNMAARPMFRPAAEAEADSFVQGMRAIGPQLERDMSAGRLT